MDPGTNLLGYATIEIQGRDIALLEVHVLKLDHLKEQPEKLRTIFERLQGIIQHYQPGEMAIEAPFYGKNVQSMLKLGRAQGVAIAAAVTLGLQVTEYAPRKIKQAITGKGNAGKRQVAAMLEHILGTTLDHATLDATDALATAVCHFFQSRHPGTQTKSYSSWKAFLKENPERKR